ncbi:ATP-binding protein [Frisingicoccus sp.]
MNIRDLIGEAADYDKKQALEYRKPKSWCKSISAFANGTGGKLIFGVADDGELVGLADAEMDAERISEAIKVHLNPIPDFNLSFEKDDDKTFIVVQVSAGIQTPYYYEGDGQLIAYVRVGNESVPASSMKIRELVLKGSGQTYDSLRSQYDFNEMSFTKLRSVYRQRTGKSFEDTDYESFGIIDNNGNLTNAGALIADESPVRHSRLFCTRWNGTTKASGLIDALDDKEYSGGLIELLQSGIEFVINNSKKPWMKLSDRRVEMPEYPERAVTEGLVNALIHRSYTELGSEVHIDMFDNRLEIYSPGGMYDGTSLDNVDIMNIPSKRRNPVLADIFSRLAYMERRGSGFKKILEDYQFQGHYNDDLKPKFYANNANFILTLYNLNSNVPQDVPQNVPRNVPQDEIDSKIIELIKNDQKISTTKIAAQLGVSSKTIKRRIKEIAIISFVGRGSNGHWVILEDEDME